MDWRELLRDTDPLHALARMRYCRAYCGRQPVSQHSESCVYHEWRVKLWKDGRLISGN